MRGGGHNSDLPAADYPLTLPLSLDVQTPRHIREVSGVKLGRWEDAGQPFARLPRRTVASGNSDHKPRPAFGRLHSAIVRPFVELSSPSTWDFVTRKPMQTAAKLLRLRRLVAAHNHSATMRGDGRSRYLSRSAARADVATADPE